MRAHGCRYAASSTRKWCAAGCIRDWHRSLTPELLFGSPYVITCLVARHGKGGLRRKWLEPISVLATRRVARHHGRVLLHRFGITRFGPLLEAHPSANVLEIGRPCVGFAPYRIMRRWICFWHGILELMCWAIRIDVMLVLLRALRAPIPRRSPCL